MGCWGAKTVTTTTSVRGDRRRLEGKSVGFLQATLGSPGSSMGLYDQQGLESISFRWLNLNESRTGEVPT